MSLYRCLAGTHYEINPNYTGNNPHSEDRRVKYAQGDVVESDRPLDTLYVNKFEKVIPGLNAPMVVSPERVAAVDLLVQQGAWEEEDRTLLQEMRDSDFERMQRRSAPPSTESATDLNRKKATSILGEDVTDDFQRAYDEHFLVFRNAAGKHNVTKSNARTRPLNEEPLDTDQVDRFVDNYIKERRK